MSDWKIHYVQKPLGIAAHGVLEVVNSAGQIVMSFEGLAADGNGNFKAIGDSPSDKIQFRQTDGISANHDTTFAPQVLFSGTEAEVQSRIDAGNTTLAPAEWKSGEQVRLIEKITLAPQDIQQPAN